MAMPVGARAQAPTPRPTHAWDIENHPTKVEQVAYRYRAFGEQTVVTGSSPNRFSWAGRQGYYRQPDLGNHWLRARVYEDGSGWRGRAPSARTCGGR